MRSSSLMILFLNCFFSLYITGFHGVMVSILEFESSDTSSNLCGTYYCFLNKFAFCTLNPAIRVQISLVPTFHFLPDLRFSSIKIFFQIVAFLIQQRVPWCNGEHSGLWIQRSEFKSRWNLLFIFYQICFPNLLRYSSQIVAFLIYYRVPWSNDEHSRLWIQRSEFISRWNLRFILCLICDLHLLRYCS